MDQIAALCTYLNLKPRRVIEVGAAHPNTQRCTQFIANGCDVLLIEANPRLHYCLTEGFNYGDDFQRTWPMTGEPPYEHPGFKDHPNVQVIFAAIVDTPQAGKDVRIYERNSSSFIEGVSSPAKANDGYVENPADSTYVVAGRSIAEFDNGQVDVLMADTEGCEWFCVKNLISRPKIITLEMRGQNYVNAFTAEILTWMQENGYVAVMQDETDVAFVRIREI